MLDLILSTKHRNCDGWSRRDFLRVGAIGSLGLSLPMWLKLKAEGAVREAPAKAVIQIWLSGGPSHVDIWDPKPNAPDDFRGPFKVCQTSVPGVYISEYLPRMAKIFDRYSIIRSMTHPSPAHEIATHIVNTGNVLQGGLVYPSMGSVVALEKGFDAGYTGEIPPFVAIPSPPPWYGDAGFLGGRYAPFATGGDPNSPNFKVKGLELASGLTGERAVKRRSLLEKLDTFARQFEKQELFEVLDTYYERAYGLVLGSARDAFDLAKEDPKIRERYGRTTFGQSCLLARRLVERGVPFVTVTRGGWDTHFKNFDALQKLLPELDQALSALIEDLYDRGLLDSTIVVCEGEFGRTPKIDWSSRWQGGRHHWPNVFSVMLTGGGFQGGRIVGESTEKGEFVKDRPCYPWDLCASIYRQLGIDYKKRLPHPQGRVAYITPLAQGTIESGGLLDELL
ncbi:MAG: hypothetical protein KatS3mg027_0022 [Bacteroidia bacterium]|nr:MAG: hypothetical protein KatS3mg027_0022 [Bacteroidia bacterium]